MLPIVITEGDIVAFILFFILIGAAEFCLIGYLKDERKVENVSKTLLIINSMFVAAFFGTCTGLLILLPAGLLAGIGIFPVVTMIVAVCFLITDRKEKKRLLESEKGD